MKIVAAEVSRGLLYNGFQTIPYVAPAGVSRSNVSFGFKHADCMRAVLRVRESNTVGGILRCVLAKLILKNQEYYMQTRKRAVPLTKFYVNNVMLNNLLYQFSLKVIFIPAFQDTSVSLVIATDSCRSRRVLSQFTRVLRVKRRARIVVAWQCGCYPTESW